jgi:hypothetical protein
MPRGRPKGSKNRTKKEKQATLRAVRKSQEYKNSLTGPLAEVAQMSHEELKEKFPNAVHDLPHLEGRKPGVSIDVDKIREALGNGIAPKIQTFKPEGQPFPKDWNTMGKIDKLKWLTEHRK